MILAQFISNQHHGIFVVASICRLRFDNNLAFDSPRISKVCTDDSCPLKEYHDYCRATQIGIKRLLTQVFMAHGVGLAKYALIRSMTELGCKRMLRLVNEVSEGKGIFRCCYVTTIARSIGCLVSFMQAL